MADNNLPYNSFNRFLTDKFGKNVRRLPLDLGRGCPHRQKNPPGCLFCCDEAIKPAYLTAEDNLAAQLAEGARKFTGSLFMPYLQSGVNTAGEPAELKRLYEFCLTFPKAVGLIIATRPDYISPEVVETLAELNKKSFIIVELGLQSTHNETLIALNRGHSYEDFVKSATLLKNAGIYQAAHLILGLPGESRAMMEQSVDRLAELGINAIKFHHLQILANAPLASSWQNGQIGLLSAEEYPPLIVDLLERLPWEMHIMRLITNTNANARLAPNWQPTKDQMLLAIQKEFARRGTRQGVCAISHNLLA